MRRPACQAGERRSGSGARRVGGSGTATVAILASVDRAQLLATVRARREAWDVLVVGGGASGLGTAVEAAARGYQTLLLEGTDFAKGTSSRSTKLVHGGVRYLKQGNLALVVEALRERGRLLANAPHLVHNLAFVMPNYEWWEGPFYGAGLKVYDLLAGRLGLESSRHLTREQVLAALPTLEPAGLRGGIRYHDAQFDDARLALTLARTLHDLGGVPLNRLEVTGFVKRHGLVSGVTARDAESGDELTLAARTVVNATGVFADGLRALDDPDSAPILSPSQGIHLVLDGSFLPGNTAVLVPHTSDGRVLFAVPWLGRVIVGTTDTPVGTSALEPRPLPEEVDFLLTHAARLLSRHPGRSDVRSCFAGLRPLLASRHRGVESALLPREHTVVVSRSGLVTVAGGKWTTYRQLGEDTIDQVALLAGLDERPSRTADLRLHGAPGNGEAASSPYGSDAAAVEQLAATHAEWAQPLHPALPYRGAEVVWAARHEMALGVEDVLARRTRALFLDARASAEMAPAVARLLARELGRNETWVARETASYRELARSYWLD
jgi:glycerol-3-phosphate dehydrogenase